LSVLVVAQALGAKAGAAPSVRGALVSGGLVPLLAGWVHPDDDMGIPTGYPLPNTAADTAHSAHSAQLALRPHAHYSQGRRHTPAPTHTLGLTHTLLLPPKSNIHPEPYFLFLLCAQALEAKAGAAPSVRGALLTGELVPLLAG